MIVYNIYIIGDITKSIIFYILCTIYYIRTNYRMKDRWTSLHKTFQNIKVNIIYTKSIINVPIILN